MINRFIKFLSSMKFVVLLLLLFAFSIGYATFVECGFSPLDITPHGSATSKALIYNTWWFELLLIILAVSLILNMFKHKLFRKEKLPILAFHLSFILILIGSGKGVVSVSTINDIKWRRKSLKFYKILLNFYKTEANKCSIYK